MPDGGFSQEQRGVRDIWSLFELRDAEVAWTGRCMAPSMGLWTTHQPQFVAFRRLYNRQSIGYLIRALRRTRRAPVADISWALYMIAPGKIQAQICLY